MPAGSSRPTGAGALRAALAAEADPERAAGVQRFFGLPVEDDRFLGIPVPVLRRIARDARDLPLDALADLLADRVHEHRFTALVILVERHRRTPAARAALERFYLDHRAAADQWDLIDVSAPQLLGGADRATLDALVGSDAWTDRRMALVSTLTRIRAGELDTTYALAGRVLGDAHHLVHKGAGWMLREAGKRDEPRLVAWLDAHATRMPRTMLRYAVEKLDPAERARLMAVRPAARGRSA